MSAVISLLVIWFIISIPVAFFVGAVFTLSNRASSEVEAESSSQTTSEVAQDIY